jgi:hypothetical protein
MGDARNQTWCPNPLPETAEGAPDAPPVHRQLLHLSRFDAADAEFAAD